MGGEKKLILHKSHFIEKDGMPSTKGFALIIVTVHVVLFGITIWYYYLVYTIWYILFGIIRGLSG